MNDSTPKRSDDSHHHDDDASRLTILGFDFRIARRSPESLFSGPVIITSLGIATGALALLICGIPFVAPMSRAAAVLSVVGLLLAVLGLVWQVVTKRRLSVFLVVLAAFALATNGLAFRFAKLGKHLIDFLEGH